MTISPSLATLDATALTWPWPVRILNETVMPMDVRNGCALRLCMTSSESEKKSLLRQTAQMLERGARPTVIWLDYGEQMLPDWGAVRWFWEELCRMAGASGVQAGLRAAALTLPESTSGHLSSRFVIEAVAGLMPASRLWLGINLEARFLPALLKPDPITGVRPVDALRSLGVRVAADLPVAAKSLAEMAALPGIKGMTIAARLSAYMQLFDWMSAFRLPGKWTTHTYLRCSSKPKYLPTHRLVPSSLPHLRFEPAVSQLLRKEGCDLFSPLEFSELLLCLKGIKRLMRTSGSDSHIRRIQKLSIDLGLHTRILTVSGVMKLDRGKGGWSNLYNIDSSGVQSMESMVFIGSVEQDVEWAQQHNDDDDAELGQMLGYPVCCQAFYSRAFPLSLAHQGDLVPLVVDQTATHAPWPAKLNIFARYFDVGLISYYPCQLDCPNALNQAEIAFELLNHLDARSARNMLRILTAPVLYTEYKGIIRFDRAQRRNGELHYDPNFITSTLPHGELSKILHADKRLSVRGGALHVAGKVLRPANLRLLEFTE